jgi:hypothetical protein
MKVDEILSNTFSDGAIFWSMITAVATIVLVCVAYWQLKSLARTSRSDFLYRLKSDFFNEDARRLICLAENDMLKFHAEGEIPHFEIVGLDRPCSILLSISKLRWSGRMSPTILYIIL